MCSEVGACVFKHSIATSEFISVCVCIYIYTYIYTLINSEFAILCMNTHAPPSLHIYLQIYIYVCIYMHIHIFICIYAHTQSGPKICIHSLLINIFGINVNKISISGTGALLFSQQMAQAVMSLIIKTVTQHGWSKIVV